jgi:hypothetical protein
VATQIAKSRISTHTLNQAGEEGLVLEIGVVSLEVLLGGRDELEGNQLVTTFTLLAVILGSQGQDGLLTLGSRSGQ